ncbi:MAG: ABC transporter ATP-binding protein [Thaumarchaeota archaeon]|nr:ABC transporter ATP-binding protein [Nitrososphaerota archaeon]
MSDEKPVLDVKDLVTHFQTPEGTVQAVRGVSFDVGYGDSVGIIGESGSGKTITALSVLRLVPPPYGKTLAGQVNFKGEDLLKVTDKHMREIRGRDIGMIFQDPTSSLNPVLALNTQLGEGMREHMHHSSQEVGRRMVNLFDKVGIKPASERLHNFPHQLSGGMKQRVMIAISIACEPALVIADEPTTNLDVTIQAQILRLMKGLKDEFNTSLLYITHNLGIVAQMCKRVNVMYAGKVVESGDVRTVLKNPKHPYTMGLLKSIPKLGSKEPLVSIPGMPPNMIAIPSGCPFNPRCPYVMERCRTDVPELRDVGDGHAVSCWLY